MFSRKYLFLIVFFLFVFDFFIWSLIIFDNNGNLEIYVLDVGQGDSQLIIMPANYGIKAPKILIDGGPNANVINELSLIIPSIDRYIDLVILSHPQKDHFIGLIDVLKRYEVGVFIFNGQTANDEALSQLIEIIKENKIKYITLSKGDKIRYQDSYFDVLYPSQNLFLSSNLNDSGLVLNLISNNLKALFTGDISSKIESYLLKEYDLNTDILKVSHHGSKYSSDYNFLKTVNPKIALISAGKNNIYNHPSEEVLKRLQNIGAQIFRTDKHGTVKLVINNDQVFVFKKK